MKLKIILFFGLAGLSSYAQDKPTASGYRKPLFEFDNYKALFLFSDSQSINHKRFLRFYALSGHREGVKKTKGPYGINFSTDARPKSALTRLYMYNLTLIELLTHGLVPKDRVILEVKDLPKFIYYPQYGSKDDWIRKNTYCFELMFPEGTLGIAMLDQALSNALQLKFGKQKRVVNCLILQRIAKSEKYKLEQNTDKYKKWAMPFYNVTFSAIREALESLSMPFIDETGYSGPVYMDLEIKDWNNINDVNQKLKHYGLKVAIESRELELFVISDLK